MNRLRVWEKRKKAGHGDGSGRVGAGVGKNGRRFFPVRRDQFLFVLPSRGACLQANKSEQKAVENCVWMLVVIGKGD